MSQGASLTQQVEIFFKKAALQGALQKFLIHFSACFFLFFPKQLKVFYFSTFPAKMIPLYRVKSGPISWRKLANLL